MFDESHYESLTTPADRARYLLTLEIEAHKDGEGYRAIAGGRFGLHAPARFVHSTKSIAVSHYRGFLEGVASNEAA